MNFTIAIDAACCFVTILRTMRNFVNNAPLFIRRRSQAIGLDFEVA